MTTDIINAINDDTMMTINNDTHSIEKRSSLISERAQTSYQRTSPVILESIVFFSRISDRSANQK